jgi:hypothetical protein
MEIDSLAAKEISVHAIEIEAGAAEGARVRRW